MQRGRKMTDWKEERMHAGKRNNNKRERRDSQQAEERNGIFSLGVQSGAQNPSNIAYIIHIIYRGN